MLIVSFAALYGTPGFSLRACRRIHLVLVSFLFLLVYLLIRESFEIQAIGQMVHMNGFAFLAIVSVSLVVIIMAITEVSKVIKRRSCRIPFLSHFLS